ncbi:MAG: alpha/beta hydrolase [Bacteroidota bacterium]
MRPGLIAFHFLLSLSTAFAGQVDTLDVYSPSMNKVVRCLVITPSGYSGADKPYPVLYLLHGWSGNYTSWLADAPQLRTAVEEHRMIIVCPDGGYDSWYFDSPVDSTVRYSTHIAREVVGAVDSKYRTLRSPAGRAISGLSMGGHGAMHVAIHHPDVFGAVGSMAGGLDLRPFRKNGWDLQGVLGDPDTHWQNWEQYSVVNELKLLAGRNTPVIIDCGLGDFFLEVNRTAHQVLMEMKYPHDYTERPGEHNHAYWGNAVDYQILYFDKFFKTKPSP